MTDDTLFILHLRQGDEYAFRRLFNEHYATLCKFALQILPDKAVAEDIVDEVFFNLWQGRENIEVKSSLRQYLIGAVRNRCINHMKNSRTKMSRSAVSISDGNSADFLTSVFADDTHPLGMLIGKELEQQINRCVAEMPGECARVFMKSRVEHKKYAEIAAELGISVNTVKYHMKNALAYLHKHLEDYVKWITILAIMNF